MWDLPRPGLEPVSPALAGKFSTTAPPGKPENVYFYIKSPNLEKALIRSHSVLRLPVCSLLFKLVSFFVCFGNGWYRIKFTFFFRSAGHFYYQTSMTLDCTKFSLLPLGEGWLLPGCFDWSLLLQTLQQRCHHWVSIGQVFRKGSWEGSLSH